MNYMNIYIYMYIYIISTLYVHKRIYMHCMVTYLKFLSSCPTAKQLSQGGSRGSWGKGV